MQRDDSVSHEREEEEVVEEESLFKADERKTV